MPAGWLGLMIASLLAAYVSTIVTHLNWGTSYLVHDLYRRLLRPAESERHYVMVGRVVTACLMLSGAAFTFVLDSARQSFTLLLSIGAGTGLLYLLRWYWWRINAQAEIAAMVGSLLVAVGFEAARRTGHEVAPHLVVLLTALINTVVWVVTALLTRPTDDGTLVAFYRLVRPAGPGWARIRALAGATPAPDSLPQAMLGWVLGCILVYSALFGVGAVLYGRTTSAWVFAVAGVLSGFGVMRILRGFRTADVDARGRA
jgi:hypothetical protein